MDDRRHGVDRKPFGLPVHYRTAPQDPTRQGQTINISPGGMFVRTEHNERLGQAITIEVEVPGHGPLEVRGLVVWARTVPTHFRAEVDNGFGLRIQDAPEDWYRLFVD
jgi:hypothetical protein